MYKIILSYIFSFALFYFIFFFKLNIRKIKILLVFPLRGKSGPATLAQSYRNTIYQLQYDKYLNNLFYIILCNNITFDHFRYFLQNNNNMIWFLYPDYFYLLNNYTFTSLFKNVIYGPVVAPRKWFEFPIKDTYEEKWSFYIDKIFAYIVQSKRVKYHLVNRSAKLKNIERKYLVSHGCLYSNTSYRILSWNERKIDIIIYVKFVDAIFKKELNRLIDVLNKTYSLKIIRYGSHTKKSLIYYANNSKILIYYSFYDCWPSSLMEMQNVGIYPIVQQCEFIQKYGTCIKNFELNTFKIVAYIKTLLSKEYNSKYISLYYRKKNNCLNILKYTFMEIYDRKNELKESFLHISY